MIALQILSSSDQNIIGLYESYKTEIIVGTSKLADFPIDDPELSSIHCIFVLDGEHLSLRSSERTGAYFVNGIKYYGQKSLSKGDHIEIGGTHLHLKNFVAEKDVGPADFKEAYKQTLKSSPQVFEVLRAIEREIVYLESKNRPQT